MNKKILLKTSEVVKKLGISKSTFYRWDSIGKISVLRTLSGQRRVPIHEVDRLLGLNNNLSNLDNKLDNISCCIYLRIRSGKDIINGSLDKQKQALTQKAIDLGYKISHIIIEKGSSLKKQRPEFKQLIKLAGEKKFHYLIVQEKKSILPFGFEYFEEFLSFQGISVLTTEDTVSKESQKEIDKDLITYLFGTAHLLDLSPQVSKNFRTIIRKLLRILLNHNNYPKHKNSKI